MSQTLEPTKAKDRIIFLDVLRGFALTGILFANILSWSGLKFLPFTDIEAIGNLAIDKELYNEMKFFIDTKFYTLFSLLFGMGFYMQLSRNKDNPGFAKLYFRRLVLLLVIGLIHATFWSGDILTLYALMGMILLTMRNVAPQKLIYLAVFFYSFPILLDIIYMYTFASELPEKVSTALKVYPDMTPEQVVDGFQSASFTTTIKMNFHNLVWRWYDFIPSGRPFKILGLFLLGSYLYYKNFFTVHALQWKYLFFFLITGLVFTGISMKIPGSVAAFSKNWGDVIYRIIHEIGQLSLALSYVCILAKLVSAFPKFLPFHWFKNYGRMSLSSYLGQTFFGIVAFYPIIAWGYFGRLSLEDTYYIALVILTVQLLFSNIWFIYFKFGPVEWLWRCATYKKWFPIRKREE